MRNRFRYFIQCVVPRFEAVVCFSASNHRPPVLTRPLLTIDAGCPNKSSVSVDDGRAEIY